MVLENRMTAQWANPASVEEAIIIQKEMAASLILQDELPPSLSYIGGMDVSNNLFDPSKQVFSGAVILSYPDLQIEESSSCIQKQTFPYIPGLLSFRETPILVETFQQLRIKPQCILVDGHGIAHPRKLGIASHLGLLLNIPTIGVAKKILVGTPSKELNDFPGSYVSLIYRGEQRGFLVRTKRNTRPLIISPGHKISLETALEITLSCLNGYRLPEPTRQAHLAANASRVSHLKSSFHS